MDQHKTARDYGKLEDLEEQIRELLLQASGDYYFTEYLQKLMERVREEKYRTDLMQAELDRSYQLYLRRNPQMAVSPDVRLRPGEESTEVHTGPDYTQEPAGSDAVRQSDEQYIAQPLPGTEIIQETAGPDVVQGAEGASSVQPSVEAADIQLSAGEDSIFREGTPESGQEMPEQSAPDEGSGAQAYEDKADRFPEDSTAGQDGNEEAATAQTFFNGPEAGAAYGMAAPSVRMNGPVGAEFGTDMSLARPAVGMTGPVVRYQAAPSTPVIKKNNTEFMVGIAVFSVIGVAFILTAFVMFGMNFMSGFMKGMSLYAVSAALVGVSEGIVCRRNQKLGMAVSAIGIGGLYLSTVINYVHLHNFNGLVAVLVTAMITAGIFLLSRKKDSWLLRVIGMISCYLCCLPVQKGILPAEFLVLVLVLFSINVLCTALPVRRHRLALGITQMLGNAIFSQFLLWRSAWCGVSEGLQAVFIISSLAVLNLIFLSLLRYGDKACEEGRSFDVAGLISAFCISGVLFLTQILFIRLNSTDVNLWAKHGTVAAAILISLVFFLLERKREEKWLHYYLLNFLVLIIYGLSGNSLETAVCVLVMLAVAKLLTGVKYLCVSEAVITVLACLTAFVYWNEIYFYAFLAAIIISILVLHRWQTFYEILLTGTLVVLAALKLPSLLWLPAAVGIFFVGILLFHNVKRWKDQKIMVYNVFALAGQGVCYLAFANRIYTRAYITFVMMLVFGLATIVLTFQEHYGMNFRKKHLILACFLTYMAFFCRLGIPVLTSILLMAVALFCVGAGFAVREKSLRIYGLVLSLIVCGKMVLYDFMGAQTLQKIILFFVVGLIALFISGIYILLEKRGSHTRNQNNERGRL